MDNSLAKLEDVIKIYDQKLSAVVETIKPATSFLEDLAKTTEKPTAPGQIYDNMRKLKQCIESLATVVGLDGKPMGEKAAHELISGNPTYQPILGEIATYNKNVGEFAKLQQDLGDLSHKPIESQIEAVKKYADRLPENIRVSQEKPITTKDIIGTYLEQLNFDKTHRASLGASLEKVCNKFDSKYPLSYEDISREMGFTESTSRSLATYYGKVHVLKDMLKHKTADPGDLNDKYNQPNRESTIRALKQAAEKLLSKDNINLSGIQEELVLSLLGLRTRDSDILATLATKKAPIQSIISDLKYILKKFKVAEYKTFLNEPKPVESTPTGIMYNNWREIPAFESRILMTNGHGTPQQEASQEVSKANDLEFVGWLRQAVHGILKNSNLDENAALGAHNAICTKLIVNANPGDIGLWFSQFKDVVQYLNKDGWNDVEALFKNTGRASTKVLEKIGALSPETKHLFLSIIDELAARKNIAKAPQTRDVAIRDFPVSKCLDDLVISA